ncbi:glutathione S-transferase family protein [Pantoea ananatis]|uniref:glutathione S-transferase family protein n=1 Tax=Pantoea ananas TaxID=553 RepID=UPI002079CB0C|nr:glutathione S-transferase family protein [Pantoea ananatis]USL57940.1 glutathione S-transferase family protein [Pantoea ananatis]
MLTVWGRRTSSNVQALMWCIGEMQLPYIRHDVGHKYEGTDTDFFYSLNPNRTVPVLQDGSSTPLWETGAILRYLANRYGSETFWPHDAEKKANVDRWAEWAKINVAMAFTAPVFWRVVRTPESERDVKAVNQAMVNLERSLSIAEVQLGKLSFLAGDEFSLADIQLGHVLYRYFDIDVARQPFKNLRSYYERLSSRPAFQEHVIVSYEELRV